MQLPTVASLMTTDVLAVSPSTSLQTAARMLVQNHISGAPVVSSKELLGVVTLSDIADPDRYSDQQQGSPLFYELIDGKPQVRPDVSASEEELQCGEGQVADVMSPYLLSIDVTTSLPAAAKQMVDAGVHRVLVVSEGQLAGILTASDIVRGVSELDPGEASD